MAVTPHQLAAANALESATAGSSGDMDAVQSALIGLTAAQARTVHGSASGPTRLLMIAGWTLQPLAGLSLSRGKAGGFTEIGAGALNLRLTGQSITFTKSLLVAKACFEAGGIHLDPRDLGARVW